jgi:two-component system sensor histidine kinase YesM
MMPKQYPFQLKTVKSKLILYTLLMLIPVIFFSIMYLMQSQKILESKAGNLVSESLSLSMSWMDEVLAGAVRLSTSVESDSMLRDFLMQHEDMDLSTESVLTIRQVEDRLSEILGTEKRATSIWIYFSATHELISTQYGHYQVPDDKGLEWLKADMGQDEQRAWIYPDEQIAQAGGSLLDLTGFRSIPNVTFARVIPGTGTERYPVIVGVGYLEFTLQDIFHEVASKTKTSLLLLDHYGQPVDSETPRGSKSIPIQKVLEKLKQNKATSALYFNMDQWLVASSDSKMTGWRMVSIAPLENYMGGLRYLTWLTISFAIIAFLLAILTARSLTNGFHLPLKQLLAGMRRMEAGDLTVRIHYNRSDEFRLLSDGFNRMVETQGHLIRTVYQERIAKQQAEMNVLTAQINPHFLYNTLGALYSMAKKTDDILAYSLLAMSKLFRLSLNRGSDMMTVEDSVEQIHNYIHLLSIRNPEKYRLDAYVEPGAEKCLLPNLLIQPIVENAIQHGLETVSSNGLIRVSVTLLKSDLLLMISDNGMGMDHETLSHLRDSLQQSDHLDLDTELTKMVMNRDGRLNGSGYALRNIYRRLQLKYDQRFLFQIKSELQKGTIVSIRIPR